MKNLIVIAGALVLAAFPAMAQESPKALQKAFVAAVEAEDADALAALYTEDADSYAPDGSIAKGRDAIAASWAPFFDNYDNFVVTIDQQGELDMGGNAHAAWGLWTMSMTPVDAEDDSERETMRGRFTDVSVKTKTGWLYRADHASVMQDEPDTSDTDD